jgi:MscS family membrane protein
MSHTTHTVHRRRIHGGARGRRAPVASATGTSSAAFAVAFVAILVAVVVASFVPASAARAQLPGLGGGGSSAPAAEIPTSPLSPRAAVQEFLRLTAAQDWEEAARFLAVPPRDRARSAQLARRLRLVLDQRLAIDPRALSPLASGDTADGEPQTDRLGVIVERDGAEMPVLLVRSGAAASGGGAAVHWRFAPQSVDAIDRWFENLGNPWLRDRLPPGLMRTGPLNVFYWQWIGIAIAIPLLLLLTWLVSTAVRTVLARVAARTETDWDNLLLEHLRRPFRLWVAALLATPLLAFLDLNARVAGFVRAATRGLVLIALFWGLLRAIRLLQTRMESMAWSAGHTQQARTLVPLLGNFLRVTLGIVAILVALAQFGYPVGTLLAGLGIGGIAVALAAQKTVEHLFGSVSLAADKAFRVGDWVRAGATEGAVERIGLRSTSFRTNDRTVIRVPNGRLADERIETFGERDRMLINTNLDLLLTTTPAQVDRIRAEVLATLRAHPKIWPDVVRAHVVAFTDSAIRLNVMAWFQTNEHDEFLLIRHTLYLEFLRILERHGSGLAFPSRTIYHAQADGAAPPEPGAPRGPHADAGGA